MLQGEPLVVIDLAVPDAELLQADADPPRVRHVRGDCRAGIEQGQRASAAAAMMTTRADDSDEHVRQHRLDVYARESKPLLDYYRGRSTFRSINGAQAPDQVARELAAKIDAMVAGRIGEAVMIVCRSAAELRAAARREPARRPRARAAARGGCAGRDDRRSRRAGRARDSRRRRGAGVQGLQGLSGDDLRVGERAGRARDPVAEDGAERGRHHLDRPRRQDGRILRRLRGDGRRRAHRRRRRPTCCA